MLIFDAGLVGQIIDAGEWRRAAGLEWPDSLQSVALFVTRQSFFIGIQLFFQQAQGDSSSERLPISGIFFFAQVVADYQHGGEGVFGVKVWPAIFGGVVLSVLAGQFAQQFVKHVGAPEMMFEPGPPARRHVNGVNKGGKQPQIADP